MLLLRTKPLVFGSEGGCLIGELVGTTVFRLHLLGADEEGTCVDERRSDSAAAAADAADVRLHTESARGVMSLSTG